MTTTPSTVQTKYRLMAIDVDGTLLDGDHRVTGATAKALARASRAGIRIVLATGRSYMETAPVWRKLGIDLPQNPMILIGGAMVSEADTGRTLYQLGLEHDLACEYSRALSEAGHSAMAIVDAWRYGLDYVLVEGADMDFLHTAWFSKMNVSVRRVTDLGPQRDVGNCLRISTVLPATQASTLAEAMRARFEGRLNIHSIYAPNYDITVVEAFAAGANKWNALQYVAQGFRVARDAIIAVGDDVNDLPMIRSAGLGVAMGKAPPHVREAAQLVVGDVSELVSRLALDT